MVKRNFGTLSGKCAVCGINLYEESGNRPHIKAMPCNVKACPYETAESQAHRLQEEMRVLPAGEGMTYYEG